MGAHSVGGPGGGGVGRGSGMCLRSGVFGRRVCWAHCRPVRCAMARAGLRVGLCCCSLAGCWLVTVCGRDERCLRCRASLGLEIGSPCGCAVPGGCWGWVPTAPVFVGLGTAPLPEDVAVDGARARTFVALAAVVALDRGGGPVMVAVLREEEDEPSSRVPPAIILATAALPYVPGCGGGTRGCLARFASCWRLRGRGMPLHVR